MSQEEIRSNVAEELTGTLDELGLDLDAVELTPAGKRRVLKVVVDAEDGVTLDTVSEATREVSRRLDELDERGLLGKQPYTLEVSSRGVDRPLTLPRHWHRNSGRLVKVTFADGTALTGRIAAADDAGAVVEIDGATRTVDYDQVAKALVQVELNRK